MEVYSLGLWDIKQNMSFLYCKLLFLSGKGKWKMPSAKKISCIWTKWMRQRCVCVLLQAKSKNIKPSFGRQNPLRSWGFCCHLLYTDGRATQKKTNQRKAQTPFVALLGGQATQDWRAFCLINWTRATSFSWGGVDSFTTGSSVIAITHENNSGFLSGSIVFIPRTSSWALYGPNNAHIKMSRSPKFSPLMEGVPRGKNSFIPSSKTVSFSNKSFVACSCASPSDVITRPISSNTALQEKISVLAIESDLEVNCFLMERASQWLTIFWSRMRVISRLGYVLFSNFLTCWWKKLAQKRTPLKKVF